MDDFQKEFDKIYDIGFVKVFAKPKTGYTTIRPALQNAIEMFGITDIDKISIRPNSEFNPYICIIKDAIESILPNSPLWKNIFNINKVVMSTDTRYEHGSGTGYSNEMEKYTMTVNPAINQLTQLDPIWVYNHHAEIEEFLREDNKLLNSLVEFAHSNFPIILQEKLVS